MKWSIPAKTFLLGEYAAIAGYGAIVLTTTPCFEVTLTKEAGLQGIHPASPAGLWWMQQPNRDSGLQWFDPYQGQGGVGASSAQFLGAYNASMYLQNKPVNHEEMLQAYWQCVTDNEGLRPSGYDVLAQSLKGCVYIDRQQDICKSYAWPFQELGFFLIHTRQKLATHHHLQAISLPKSLHRLTVLVEMGKEALSISDSLLMVKAINAYHAALTDMGFVAEHTLQHAAHFRAQNDILAVKGCGAMGADVLLLLVSTTTQERVRQQLLLKDWTILATQNELYNSAAPSL